MMYCTEICKVKLIRSQKISLTLLLTDTAEKEVEQFDKPKGHLDENLNYYMFSQDQKVRDVSYSLCIPEFVY